jgi:hypothetical protein
MIADTEHRRLLAASPECWLRLPEPGARRRARGSRNSAKDKSVSATPRAPSFVRGVKRPVGAGDDGGAPQEPPGPRGPPGTAMAPSVSRLSLRRANTIPGRVGGLIARDGVSPRISGRSRPPLGARPGDGRTWTCGAAWSARWPVKPEVAGSNPVRSAERSPSRPGFPPGGTRRAQWSCRRWSVWSGSSAGRARA